MLFFFLSAKECSYLHIRLLTIRESSVSRCTVTVHRGFGGFHTYLDFKWREEMWLLNCCYVQDQHDLCTRNTEKSACLFSYHKQLTARISVNDLFLLQIFNFPFNLVKLHSVLVLTGIKLLLLTVNSSVRAEPTRFECIYLIAKLKNCNI